MSTRCLVGIVESPDVIHSIYCYWDGYPEHMLPTLMTSYNTREKIEQLIALGNCFYIGHEFGPAPDGNVYREDTTCTYHRDLDRAWEHEKPFDIPFNEFSTEQEFAYCWSEFTGWRAFKQGQPIDTTVKFG